MLSQAGRILAAASFQTVGNHPNYTRAAPENLVSEAILPPGIEKVVRTRAVLAAYRGDGKLLPEGQTFRSGKSEGGMSVDEAMEEFNKDAMALEPESQMSLQRAGEIQVTLQQARAALGMELPSGQHTKRFWEKPGAQDNILAVAKKIVDLRDNGKLPTEVPDNARSLRTHKQGESLLTVHAARIMSSRRQKAKPTSKTAARPTAVFAQRLAALYERGSQGQSLSTTVKYQKKEFSASLGKVTDIAPDPAVSAPKRFQPDPNFMSPPASGQGTRGTPVAQRPKPSSGAGRELASEFTQSTGTTESRQSS